MYGTTLQGDKWLFLQPEYIWSKCSPAQNEKYLVIDIGFEIFWNIYQDIIYCTIQKLAKCVQSVGRNRIPIFEPPDSRAADIALNL